MKSLQDIIKLTGITSYEVDSNENGISGIKSAVIWGHTKNGSFPLLYLTKPKSMDDETYRTLIKCLHIEIYENMTQ